ncbi:MAG: choice-of-anchor L domain-containing protein, partial [Rhodovulum sp.]|nr:choice-of-anchor L domain-containing protein [Rhodovulum sp.]
MVRAADLDYDTNATAVEMAETIFGEGITVVSASYSGDQDSSAIYSGGDTIAPGVTPSDSGVILSTGDATDFTNRSRGNAEANQETNTSTNTSGVNNDADFNELAGASTFDAAILDVDFIPEGDTMTLQFVFASEEYPEFTNSIYNDVVGIWINGELVPLEIAGETTSIGNVNDVDNQNLYVDNTNSDFNTEMDGFTVTMTVTIPVVPGEVNSIRIGIADVADSNFDSSVLIAAESGQSAFIANADVVNVAPGETATVDVLANDISRVPGTVTITHINGVPVVAGDTVTLATGQQITLNPDGTFTVVADADTESVSFTYTAENDVGLSDTGFVTVNSV